LAPVNNPSGGSTPNTTMRAAVERRTTGIPGDLGWQRVGGEVELSAAVSGFNVTWTATIPLPGDQEQHAGQYRMLITEVETFLRDMMPGDPGMMTSPRDFVRERVVYADVFEI
jgi:hypothetical protein